MSVAAAPSPLASTSRPTLSALTIAQRVQRGVRLLTNFLELIPAVHRETDPRLVSERARLRFPLSMNVSVSLWTQQTCATRNRIRLVLGAYPMAAHETRRVELLCEDGLRRLAKTIRSGDSTKELHAACDGCTYVSARLRSYAQALESQSGYSSALLQQNNWWYAPAAMSVRSKNKIGHCRDSNYDCKNENYHHV